MVGMAVDAVDGVQRNGQGMASGWSVDGQWMASGWSVEWLTVETGQWVMVR